MNHVTLPVYALVYIFVPTVFRYTKSTIMSFLRFNTIDKFKARRRQYDASLLKKAFHDVKVKGLSVYKAARVYGVPESTLRDRTLGLQPVGPEYLYSGSGPTLSKDEEVQLVSHVEYMSKIGYGYSRKEFLGLASEFAVSLGKKRSSDPEFTATWYSGFKTRNPTITIAKPQKLSILRAKSTSPDVMDEYFKELEKVLKQHDLVDKPQFIWNVDETGLMMEHNPRHIVCIKGQPPNSITSARGKTVTIIAGGSAAGNRLPPYYVFPGMRWRDDLLDNACPGATGTVTETGWSNTVVFMDYIENHFKAHVSSNNHPVLVLFDGHKSHVHLTLAEWGKKHNLVFFVLPPHTSHVTQPLDVGCFGPLKNAYYSECQSYLRNNPGMQINRYNIAEISSKAYNKSISPDNLISAFRRTGVSPLEKSKISSVHTAPSTIYKENVPPTKSDSFLEQMEIHSVKTPLSSRKRTATPPVFGNITSPTKMKILRQQTTPHLPKSKSKTNPRRILSPKPSTSGLSNNKPVQDISSDDEDESLCADEDLCCVCKKHSPDRCSYQLEFINWGQCDKCQHWTHLKYCTPVTCLRRGSAFLCPHCDM